MSIRVSNIRLTVDESEFALPSQAARALNLRTEDISSWRILRKSLDARDKSALAFVYSIEVAVDYDERRIVKLASNRPSQTSAGTLSRAHVRDAGRRSRPIVGTPGDRWRRTGGDGGRLFLAAGRAIGP